MLWISFRPFENLADAQEVTQAGNIPNQIGYSLLFVLPAAWSLAHQPSRLLLLIRPVFIAAPIWFALSVVTSWEPALAARRFAFTLIGIGIAGMVLLPKHPALRRSNLKRVVRPLYNTPEYGFFWNYLRPTFSISRTRFWPSPMRTR